MGYLILFVWLILLPFCVGGILVSGSKQKALSDSLASQWLWGSFLLWAVFQLVAVWFILNQGKLEDVVLAYGVATVGLGFLGLMINVHTWIKVDKARKIRCSLWKSLSAAVLRRQAGWTQAQKVLAGVFGMLWLVQMIALCLLAVNDGDDAFYMAVAHKTGEDGSLYTANVYSFGHTELNYRYAMAPFPVWIAFLSRISGVHTLVIGHVVLGAVLVTMSYVIYAEVGKLLFGEDRTKRLFFLIIIAVLYIWGNTSSHTAESFLLLRSRQGKALVAGLVFPAAVCLILKIGKQLEEKARIGWQYYVMGSAIILTGCLGSTLGGALVILLWASALLLLAIGYKRWSILPFGALSTIPGLVYAILYLLN